MKTTKKGEAVGEDLWELLSSIPVSILAFSSTKQAKILESKFKLEDYYYYYIYIHIF